MNRESRHYTRHLIPEESLLPCEGVNRPLKGQVSVMGLGGMFVRTRESYPIGTALEVRIHAPDDVIDAQCVVRDVLPGGLGLEFTKLRGKHEDVVRTFLERLKN